MEERRKRGRKHITAETRGGGIFIVFVTTVCNDRIFRRYSNVTRATLLCTVSNGNEETVTIFICLCNGNGATVTIFMCLCNGNDATVTIYLASVTVTK